MGENPTFSMHTAPWAERLGEAADSFGPAKGAVGYMARVAPTFFQAPGFHRLSSVLGLFLGFFFGHQVMDAIHGQNIKGVKNKKEDLPFYLQPLHNILPYNRFSDDPHDRWLHVMHLSIPAFAAAAGCYAGSSNFIEGAINKKHTKPEERVNSNPVYASNLADLERSKSYGVIAAVSALFGSSSGLTDLWLLNYSKLLNLRFPLGAGQNVSSVMPGPIGAWINKNIFSNPTILTQRADLVTELKKYLLHNPSLDPQKTQEYVTGILNTFFKGLDTETLKKAITEGAETLVNTRKDGPTLKDAKALNEALDGLLSTPKLMDFFNGLGLFTAENPDGTKGMNFDKFSIGNMGFITKFSRIMDALVGRPDVVEKLNQGVVSAYKAQLAMRGASK